jgi:hypothetical protein
LCAGSLQTDASRYVTTLHTGVHIAGGSCTVKEREVVAVVTDQVGDWENMLNETAPI